MMLNITNNNILIVGDVMLDSYWIGEVSRISPEAPVPVFLKRKKRSVPGGASNVAANMIAAGQMVSIATIVGDDYSGTQLMQTLQNAGCGSELFIKKKDRLTTEKTRLLAQNNQQLIRIDDEEISWLTQAEEDELFGMIEQRIDSFDAIVLSDYLKGILTESICQRIISLARKKMIPVYCDVKDPNYKKYKGAFLIKPNKKELGLLTGLTINRNGDVENACKLLAERCDNEFILVTLGSHGMALYHRGDASVQYIKAQTRDVYDVSGAGDTVISYLVSCITSGMSVFDAAYYANIAAGIKVGKVGTATVSIDELNRAIGNDKVPKNDSVNVNKVISLPKLLEIIKHRSNADIVFTNGCFDILHAGHVMYLEQAARYGDILIVAVNSDDSVRRLKGPSRPINAICDRLAVLSGLQAIDYLVVFEEDTPESLVKSIKPDVLVKGSDYEGKTVVGADYVQSYGGKVILIPVLENHSTTGIIKKMEENGEKYN